MKGKNKFTKAEIAQLKSLIAKDVKLNLLNRKVFGLRCVN